MSPPTSALSQTLESITLTKIKELEKQRDKYEAEKSLVLREVDAEPSQRVRIAQLLVGVRKIYPAAAATKEVKNIRFWLTQSHYDVSVPNELLQSYEDLLRSKLEVQSRKFGLGHLYARLVTEWMTASAGEEEAAAAEEESFEVVDRQKQRLQELCDKFEKVVFEPLDTDEVQIDLYLRSLFENSSNEDEGVKSLKELRSLVGDRCENLFSEKNPFTESVLDWCIKGLLAEDLLSDEKQSILREFLDNPVVLAEMVDVLNMRFSDIENWDWQAGESGIPVLPRQQLNGKYRIWMDEDVLQAIIIHYVGIRCCVGLKADLKSFIVSGNTIWKWNSSPVPSEKDDLRRTYYLGSDHMPYKKYNDARKTQYANKFFTSFLPDDVNTIGGYDTDKESNGKGKGANIKQDMLKVLASEALLEKNLNGEVAMIQTDLEWFATGMSHSTIFSVMRFFGYTEPVIAFFKKVLQAPLNVFSPDAPNGKGPRTRKRGVPMAHAPEKLTGELILFVMDLAVNQADGMLMYRIHDDLWLCGKPDHVTRAWKTMDTVASFLGLKFNQQKTGSVYFSKNEKDPEIENALPKGDVRVGHLLLDPKTEEWRIDEDQVVEHVHQLKKQLHGCTSILQWVQTWNSCMGRFFSHTFGDPAFCFGAEHVNNILKTYRWMQQFLFCKEGEDESQCTVGVVEHIKNMIHEKFGVDNIPDAFIYLPEQCGGLGLRNPFIRLLDIRKSFDKSSPQEIIDEFFHKEEKSYNRAKKAFEDQNTVQRRVAEYQSNVARGVADIEDILTAQELETFMSMDEFVRYRAARSSWLVGTYQELLKTPYSKGPSFDEDVEEALGDCHSAVGIEALWAMQIHRDVLKRDYDGMELVEREYLPLGVLTVMRTKAVRWTMVL